MVDTPIIRAEIGVEPTVADVVVASTDQNGTPGRLNQYILKSLGLSNKFLPNRSQLNKGFHLVEEENKKILFVQTVGANSTEINVNRYLSQALYVYQQIIYGKTIWVPLIGTGSGGLSYRKSFDLVVNALLSGKDYEVPWNGAIVSLPNDISDEDQKYIQDQLYELQGQSNDPSAKTSFDFNLKELLEKSSNYWWLHADISKWDIDKLKIGESRNYGAFDSSGKKQRYFKDLKIGDIVIGYQGAPEMIVKGIFQIESIDLDSHVSFKLVYRIQNNPTLNELLEFPNFEKSTINKVRVGSIHKLDKEILNEILSKTELNLTLSNNSSEVVKDKIPFHYDRVVDEDKLGREPVAKAFADLIKKDIFTKDLHHAFIVHLQGEWGAGKSTFLNLIKKHLNEGDQKWVVIEYNAWKNQHLKPPWWTFIDQVYHQAYQQLSWSKLKLYLRENFRRIIWYTGWQKILALVFTLVFGCIMVFFGDSLFDHLINSTSSNEKVSNTAKGLTIDVFAKLLLTISSLIGVLYSFSKFLSTPFFMTSSEEAQSFMKRASDPLKRIKDHFSKLVDNINEDKQLAIFIDDIDRCDRSFIVELLEGVQTLFKNKKVLYIVAGDKKWISTSFQNHYCEFDTEKDTANGKLGDLFLEKAFQLSIRMPHVSEQHKQKFWSHILGVTSSQKEAKSFNELNDSAKAEVNKEIEQYAEEIQKPEFMKQMEEKYNLTSDAVSSLVIEEKNKDDKELKHMLEDFHEFIDTNPRSIIRLANFYTMTRSTLIAERKDFDSKKLFRWLVFKNLQPNAAQKLLKEKTKKNFEEQVKSTQEKAKNLMHGINGQESLTIEDIYNLEGLA